MPPNLSRKEIEEKAKEDLSKTDLQLLTDIHQEILRNDRPLKENAIHAMKRFSSLVTRSTIASKESSEENSKLQKGIRNMTRCLTWFTIFLFFIALIQLYVAAHTFLN